MSRNLAIHRGGIALPANARMNEAISLAIAGNGNHATVKDVLPAQLVYVSASTTCHGTVTFDVFLSTEKVPI